MDPWSGWIFMISLIFIEKIFWFLFVVCLFPAHSFSLEICALLGIARSLSSLICLKLTFDSSFLFDFPGRIRHLVADLDNSCSWFFFVSLPRGKAADFLLCVLVLAAVVSALVSARRSGLARCSCADLVSVSSVVRRPRSLVCSVGSHVGLLRWFRCLPWVPHRSTDCRFPLEILLLLLCSRIDLCLPRFLCQIGIWLEASLVRQRVPVWTRCSLLFWGWISADLILTSDFVPAVPSLVIFLPLACTAPGIIFPAHAARLDPNLPPWGSLLFDSARRPRVFLVASFSRAARAWAHANAFGFGFCADEFFVPTLGPAPTGRLVFALNLDSLISLQVLARSFFSHRIKCFEFCLFLITLL
jgi:hypothetical protein